ncbi:MAG: PIN domain-containing protein [Tepidisphaeraceae bacterium]
MSRIVRRRTSSKSFRSFGSTWSRSSPLPVPAKLLKIDLRDLDDLGILSAAVAAGADVLVTGDKDLLDVARKSPVKIVSPRGFIEML